MAMPKNLIDRLARANSTLMRRRPTTPYGRIAAAQRWNRLADIGEAEVERLEELADRFPTSRNRSAYVNADEDLVDMGIGNGEGFRADNPFLSDDINKYQEQSEFLDWCRYNRIRPTPKSLQQFRWETYRSLPRDRKEAIFDKFERSYGYPVEPGDVWLGIDDMPDFLPPGWFE